MPITIEVGDEVLQRLKREEPTTDKKSPTSSIDFLPAGFREDATADRARYFDNYTQVDEQRHLRNALRGYPLIGERVPVPAECIGAVLQETRPPLHKDSDRLLRVTETFDEFTYWNYDKVPSKGDAYQQALQVLAIAQELARPVSADDVAAEMQRSGEK